VEISYKPQKPKQAVSSKALEPKNVRVVLIVGAALVAVGAALYFLL